MKYALIASALICVLFSACEKGPSVEINTPVRSEVALDISTPDKSLKSYWAVLDDMRSNYHELSKRLLSQYRSVEQRVPLVAAGGLTKDIQSGIGVFESFSRDIVEVKVESDSRAVILAVVKNVTPIPAGADVTKFDEEKRRDGERYRYVLERDQTGWRVAEIWEWERYPSADWKKSRPRDPRPSVPWITHRGM